MVDLVYSMIDFQLEYDMKRYAETCEKRREAGKKGGRPRKQEAEEAETEKPETEKPDAFYENLCEAQKPDTVTETETETDTETVTETDTVTDTETASEFKTSRRRRQSSRRAGACEDAPVELVFYTEHQIPTTEDTLAQADALARELFCTYRNRQPGAYDFERVFERCYGIGQLPDGDHYAVYSPEKADLLRHVFKQAADQENLNWKYIDGIYENYARRGVETLAEAVENEYRWNRGEITV